MRSTLLFSALIGLSVAVTWNPHEKAAQYKKPKRSLPVRTDEAPMVKRSTSYLTANTKPFAVDGAAIPDVSFNIGESYAGTLSINGNKTNTDRLWFWFFPSENPKAKDEITIWLNGGPGCSSLDGLLQENGPFQWQSGTYAPIQNPYSWTNLTNVIYVDQPVGVGFSPGVSNVQTELDVAHQFMGFWKNFMETFGLEGRKVYITGESYAGQYIPYIAGAMLDAKNKDYYNVAGIQINDPSINNFDVTIEAPSTMALNYFSNIFNLNKTTMDSINSRAASCGYTAFMEEALTFPPKGKLPTAPSSQRPGCDVWGDAITAAYYLNPCFNFYHLTDFCPFLWDQMVFPSLAGGPENYFNRSDVQKAIHAPPTNYAVCVSPPGLFPNGDLSVPSGLGPLPSVIERTNNVLIGHGLLDFLLFANGTLATIQNMTWNGKQGFQKAPSDLFFVPYHPGLSEVAQGTAGLGFTQDAGSGYLGLTHTERGLTFSTVDNAGHEIPQYSPGAGYRHLEFLLGRIPSLTTIGDFTTLPGNFGPTHPKRDTEIEMEVRGLEIEGRSQVVEMIEKRSRDKRAEKTFKAWGKYGIRGGGARVEQ